MFKNTTPFIPLLAVLLLSSCASWSKYDFKQGKFVQETYCHGRNASWNTCYANARKTCPTGFTIIKQDGDHANLGHGVLGALAWEGLHAMTYGSNGSRRLLFTCKK
jgi:hypothetical protein